MKNIGFVPDHKAVTPADNGRPVIDLSPRKSVVNVYFPQRKRTLPYYNDKFDLQCGDRVYVEGSFEGLQGEVVDVTYSFKIKLSDYKRVIAVADTSVKGQLYLCGSHILTFDKSVLPYEKARSWFFASAPDTEYVTGDDSASFPLDDLNSMNIGKDIADRGYDYYMSNRVSYICIDGSSGRAIVNGSKYYEVEFTYNNGEISNLVCSCFCSYTCKHEFAVMLQLTECLNVISEDYKDKDQSYFAAVSKQSFISNVLLGKRKGGLLLDL